MNKDSWIDWLSATYFKRLGPLVRMLPIRFGLWMGRIWGELFYLVDRKHSAVAYANIKTALGGEVSPKEASKIVRGFYRAYGENFFEIFFIPLIDKRYIDRYITIEGLSHISEALSKKKGLILLGAHEGSWELSNIVSANLGFTFNLLIQDQKYPRLNALLNFYRRQKGCRILERKNQLRQLIEALKENQAVGMTIDQGGKAGMHVSFFGKDASMSTGAVRLALRYHVPIVPVFFSRVKGPYVKIVIEAPYEVKRGNDEASQIKENLQSLVGVFEKHIRREPKEYLWTYKIWKYSSQRRLLILSDGKTGHLRQSQALAGLAAECLAERQITATVDTVEVSYRRLGRQGLLLSAALAGKYSCQGCLGCFKGLLSSATYQALVSRKYDCIISCGSALSALNYILARDNLAKSIVILRPSVFSVRKFGLVIMPRHDKPPKRSNVVVTDGALNLIDDDYLKQQGAFLGRDSSFRPHFSHRYIGVLLGGNTKDFMLEPKTVKEMMTQVKNASLKWNAGLMLTTSRRTPVNVETLVKQECKDFPFQSFLLIANEQNRDYALGGILGLSSIVVVSAESISMISEAVSAGRYVIVCRSKVDARHRGFLEHMAGKKYIYLSEAGRIQGVIDMIQKENPPIPKFNDRDSVREGLKKIL